MNEWPPRVSTRAETAIVSLAEGGGGERVNKLLFLPYQTADFIDSANLPVADFAFVAPKSPFIE